VHDDKELSKRSGASVTQDFELTNRDRGAWLVTTADAIWRLDLDSHSFQTVRRGPDQRHRPVSNPGHRDAGLLAFVAQCRLGEPLIVFVEYADPRGLQYELTSPVERIVASDGRLTRIERGHDEAS
jgi:hypothetical protein